MKPIPALVPRMKDGAQFIFCGDCCSGVPNAPFADNFAAVSATIQRLSPPPEFLLFLGDHIAGAHGDAETERRQWRHFLDREMSWLDRDISHYPTTSNHNTYNADGETVFREAFPDLPCNGPSNQEGLSYWVRRGPLLLIVVNTNFSGLGGMGHVECAWLDRVLTEQADVPYKLVAGHHPVFTVNGYARYPLWRIVPEEGEAFWRVLVRHRVLAYLCSHIIAFDAQVHDGVLQLCSGGAGTNYGPHGFMPGPTEYLHCVQVALDAQGLRCQVLDVAGTCREQVNWPPPEPDDTDWCELPDVQESAPDGLRIFRCSGSADASAARQTLISGWSSQEARCTLAVMIEHSALVIELIQGEGKAPLRWIGLALPAHQPLAFDLALHPDMGPGGVLWRTAEHQSWSSCTSQTANGLMQLPWPDAWHVGHGVSGSRDCPFRGQNLTVRMAGVPMR